MNLKACLLLILLLSATALHAQDKIYKKDGSIIEARVKTVGRENIIYTRFDNPDGAAYSIDKSTVIKIVYQNGTTDVFEKSGNREKYRRPGKAASPSGKYGRSIISVIPLAYTFDGDGSMSDPGVGINYERFLERLEHVSFSIPVLISFKGANDFNNYANQYTVSGVANAKGYTSVSFMPGIKFYPSGRANSVRYSLGGSFFYTFGNEPTYSPTSNNISIIDTRYRIYGFMLSNSVNISASKHLFLAVDLNTGIIISDDRGMQNNNDGEAPLPPPVMQLVLKIGYRY